MPRSPHIDPKKATATAEAILDRIAESARTFSAPSDMKDLAEAFALVVGATTPAANTEEPRAVFR